MPRQRKPSNAVVKGAAVGTPAAIVTSYATFRIASKFGVPFDVAAAGVGLLVQGISSLVHYAARGGRRGEAD